VEYIGELEIVRYDGRSSIAATRSLTSLFLARAIVLQKIESLHRRETVNAFALISQE
jgi:hypothetical protein